MNECKEIRESEQVSLNAEVGILARASEMQFV